MKFKIIEADHDTKKKELDPETGKPLPPTKLRHAMPCDDESEAFVRRATFRTKADTMLLINPDDLPLGSLITIQTP